MRRIALFAALVLAPAFAAAQTATVLGNTNQFLADGSTALGAGKFEEGIKLTLAGLELPNNRPDEAAAHSNLCAGYAALKRWTEALNHCNRSLEIDRGNWRTFNNRAAVFVAMKLYDLAMTDVNSGLELAPNSTTLRKSLEVVQEHRQAALRDRKRRPVKA